MTAIDSPKADPEKKIFVIGDLLIDRTYYVDVPKLSPEAPVPVAMLTGDSIDTPGGAGLAAAFATVNNIPVVLGTYTSYARGVITSRPYNFSIISVGPDTSSVNSIKTRYIDNESHYHLLRVDNDNLIPPPFVEPTEESTWFELVEQELNKNNIGILVLLDYQKGFFNKTRSQRLISIAHDYSIPVYVDSRCHNLKQFTGAEILKLNTIEFDTACQLLDCKDSFELSKKLNIRYIIKTKGAGGAEIWDGFDTNADSKSNYSHKPEIKENRGLPDVTGCGDAFDSTFCYYWGIKKVGFYKALKIAVERASQFAYEPLRTRLTCQN